MKLDAIDSASLAHGSALKSQAGIVSAVICISLAVMIGSLPKVLFQLQGAVEGALPDIGILAGIGCFHWMYVRRLHENVKQLARSKFS